MSYVDNVLQPGENVKVRATIHWLTYLNGLVTLAVAVAIFIGARQAPKFELVLNIVALAVAALAGVLLLRAWFHLWGTEIAVTDHRLIYKTGVIQRRTIEMNLDQIEFGRGGPVHSRPGAGLWRHCRARHRRRHRDDAPDRRPADRTQRHHSPLTNGVKGPLGPLRVQGRALALPIPRGSHPANTSPSPEKRPIAAHTPAKPPQSA